MTGWSLVFVICFILGDLFYCLFVCFCFVFVFVVVVFWGVITMYVTSTFVYRLLVSL